MTQTEIISPYSDLGIRLERYIQSHRDHYMATEKEYITFHGMAEKLNIILHFNKVYNLSSYEVDASWLLQQIMGFEPDA